MNDVQGTNEALAVGNHPVGDQPTAPAADGSHAGLGVAKGMRRFHMAQSIEGPLMMWRTPDWKRALKFMTKDDGARFRSVEELKQAFLDELAQGHKYIPLGECDNFDFGHGCRGHDA